MRLYALCLLSIGVLLTGCSLDYGAALTDEDIAKNTPNTIIEDLKYVSVRQGKPMIEINAQRALSYETKKETHLESVTFYEYNAKGELASEGSGDFGIYFQETENVEMEGNLNLYSKPEEAGISAEYLYWTKETKELTGKHNTTVKILRDDGSYIQGKEFYGKLQEKSFTFDSESSGMFVINEDDEDAEKDKETGNSEEKAE